MMELYVARHGQIDWNALGKLCGRTDIPLNETGKAQAHALAERLAEQGVKPQLIVCSPLTRTRQTAAILAETLSAPIEADERLIEVDHGVFEGKSNKDPAFLAAKPQMACRYPQGESVLQVAQRVYNFLDELKTRAGLQTVVVVSHGGLIRVLNTYFEDVPNEVFPTWATENATARHYQL